MMAGKRVIAFIKQGEKTFSKAADGGWVCAPCANGSGTCCAKKSAQAPCDVCGQLCSGRPDIHMTAMRKMHEAKREAVKKDAAGSGRSVNAEADAYIAITEEADRIRNARGGSMTYEASIVEALRVNPGLAAAYAAQREAGAGQASEPGGGRTVATPVQPKDDPPARGAGGGRTGPNLDKAVAAFQKARQAELDAQEPVSKAARTLKQARLAKGWTQERLADEIGCERRSIIAVEKHCQVSGLLLTAVCNALGVDVMTLGR